VPYRVESRSLAESFRRLEWPSRTKDQRSVDFTLDDLMHDVAEA